jgi:methionine-rich copper-binding protein CopC
MLAERTMRTTRPLHAARLCALAASALLAAGAHAHAMLDHADPRVGSQVATAPSAVKLWFSEALEGSFSSVSVTDASGKRVDRNDTHVDGSNKALLQVSLQPLPPGTYTVHWRAVSIDTHVTQGDFSFRVGH